MSNTKLISLLLTNITITEQGYVVAGGTKRDVITGILGEEVEQMKVMEEYACSVSEEEVLFKVKNDGMYDMALHGASYENMMELTAYFVKEYHMGAHWYIGNGYYYLCLFNEWDMMEAACMEDYNEDDSYNPCYDDAEHMNEVNGVQPGGNWGDTTTEFPEEEDLPF